MILVFLGFRALLTLLDSMGIQTRLFMTTLTARFRSSIPKLLHRTQEPSEWRRKSPTDANTAVNVTRTSTASSTTALIRTIRICPFRRFNSQWVFRRVSLLSPVVLRVKPRSPPSYILGSDNSALVFNKTVMKVFGSSQLNIPSRFVVVHGIITSCGELWWWLKQAWSCTRGGISKNYLQSTGYAFFLFALVA